MTQPVADRVDIDSFAQQVHRRRMSNGMSAHPFTGQRRHSLRDSIGFVPELPMGRQLGEALRWRVADARTATPHQSGKVAAVGHTPQLSGEVLDLGFLVCIDTNCARGCWLTALDTDTGQIWQADRAGKLRTGTKAT